MDPNSVPTGNQIADSVKGNIGRNYLTYFRFVFKGIYALINFLRFNITNMIKQVLSQD